MALGAAEGCGPASQMTQVYDRARPMDDMQRAAASKRSPSRGRAAPQTQPKHKRSASCDRAAAQTQPEPKRSPSCDRAAPQT